MNQLARVLMGTATAIFMVALGLSIFSWRFWVMGAWILIHSMVWAYLDRIERHET